MLEVLEIVFCFIYFAPDNSSSRIGFEIFNVKWLGLLHIIKSENSCSLSIAMY